MNPLYMFCGLPGSGKTTLSRMLAQHLGAVHLRVDAIEAGLERSLLEFDDLKDSSYCAAQELARENLSLGQKVVVDAVFWLAFLRPPWNQIAQECGAQIFWVEITCSDARVRQARIDARAIAQGRKGRADIGALQMDRVTPPKVTLETENQTEEEAFEALLRLLR